MGVIAWTIIIGINLLLSVFGFIDGNIPQGILGGMGTGFAVYLMITFWGDK